MYQLIRAAAISFVPRKFDLEANADRLEELFRRAAERGAQLASHSSYSSKSSALLSKTGSDSSRLSVRRRTSNLFSP